MAYTEPDIKTNSPSCWKNDVQDFSLLCPLWLKWRTFPNRVYVCVFLRDLAESLGAGRWTAWLWRERTMAWLYPSIQSSCRPSDSWAADPPSVPLLRTSSGNMAHTFCFQLHSEVLEQSWLFIYIYAFWQTLLSAKHFRQPNICKHEGLELWHLFLISVN